MNRERRKQIEAIQERLMEIKGELETLQQEEQDYADNMPENMHGNERHEKAEGSAQCLQDAVDALEEIDTHLLGALE